MFKKLKNNQGMGSIVEYALMFFLIVAVVTAMSVYFRRAIQGRIRDSVIYMANSVANEFAGNVWYQYEPYYLNSDSRRAFESQEREILLPTLPTASSGIYQKDIDQTSTAETRSEQAPPAVAR